MLDNGIMRSAKSVIKNLKIQTNPVTETTDDKPVVAIMTWERPEALERLLKSVVSNCDAGKFHCLYVIDDSRKRENIKQNQALVSEFAQNINTPLHYIGQSEQQSFIEKLANKLPEHKDAIRFLTDQNLWTEHLTYGLSRNWAIFLSCGRRLVVLDDDVICEVYEPPGQKPNITLSDTPRENDFFANEGEWAHLRQPINPDPIDRHMQCLGLSLSEAVTVLGQQYLKPANLRHATSLVVSELQTDSPVLITQSGMVGCPGTNTNTWLPSMDEESLEKMLASEKKTAFALNTRKVWSSHSNPHFSPHSNMSQITGLDNRQMLPPYLPIMRGEDLLFGHMTDFIFPTSVALDYPWAVPHLPIPEREWQDKDLEFKPLTPFPMFFFSKILEYKSACQSVEPGDRLLALSAWYRDLASTSPESLLALYRDDTLSNVSSKLKHMDELLVAAKSAPVDWQNYLRNGIRQLNAGLDAASREDMPVKGIPDSLEGNELLTFWKETWMGFAEALAVWPEIRQAAKEVIESGVFT